MMQTVSNSPTSGAAPFNPVPGADSPTEVSVDEPIVEQPEQALEQPVGDEQTQSAEIEAEDEARKHGWVPKDEWRGAPERWRPASEFLEVRTRITEIVRDENQQLRAKLAAMEAKQNERDRREAEERNRLTRDTLKMELQRAQEENDWGKVNEITDKILDLKVSEVATPKQPSVDPAVREVFNQFAGVNPWLQKDKNLAANFAIELSAVVQAKAASDMPHAMQIAKERVMRLYPEKFRANGTRRPAMVETGGTPGGNTNGRTWADLLPDVRNQAQKDVDAKKYTREQFLAECEPEHFRR